MYILVRPSEFQPASTRRLALNFTNSCWFLTYCTHLTCRNFICQHSAIVETRVKQSPLAFILCDCRCWESPVSRRTALFLAATKQLYEWYFLSVCPSVRLSVCLSVRLSVCPSHLFDYVPIIVSSWNFQELSHWTRVRSMQKVKVRGQRSRSQRSRPKFSFPDCNSSLNSHMMIKLYI